MNRIRKFTINTDLLPSTAIKSFKLNKDCKKWFYHR